MMKIVKITSLGCPSCIVMTKVFNEFQDKYDFILEEYTYDHNTDYIEDHFEINHRIPTYIFYQDNKEVGRIVGENKLEEFVNLYEKYNKEDN